MKKGFTLPVFIVGICLPSLFFTGCGLDPAKTLSRSEAQREFTKILKEENNFEVVTKEFENSFWVYLPLEESFLKMKAKKKSPASSSPQAGSLPTVRFLEGEYTDGDFAIRYDIGNTKAYAKDYGYTSGYTETYQAAQQNILSAAYRVFTSAENSPLFFVIIVADIENGLESQILVHANDLKRAFTDQLFHGEYSKRVISDQPVGSPAIIGDRTGKHLKFYDIHMPEFIARQTVCRVNFRYSPNSLPPEDEPRIEILKAAAAAVDAYDFGSFGNVRLEDLNGGTVETVSKEKLARYSEEPPSEGRLINIKFR